MGVGSLILLVGEPFADHSVPGAYCCAGCGAQLYDSVTKIASTAFPSFKRANLVLFPAAYRSALTMPRELLTSSMTSRSVCGEPRCCAQRCGNCSVSHAMQLLTFLQCKAPLGHVYKEGKAKQRHVLLSRALKFREDEEQVRAGSIRSFPVSNNASNRWRKLLRVMQALSDSPGAASRVSLRSTRLTLKNSAMRRLEPIIAATVPVLVVAALIWLRRRSERGSSE